MVPRDSESTKGSRARGLAFVTAMMPLLAAVWTVNRASAGHLSGSHEHGPNGSQALAQPVVYLGDSVSVRWDPVLASASADWNGSGAVRTVVVRGRAKPGACRPAAGRIEVCSAHYGETGWLSVAQLWSEGRDIKMGTIQLNDTYLARAPHDTSALRRLVLCQQVGHSLGLHPGWLPAGTPSTARDPNFEDPDLGSCLHFSGNPAANQRPNSFDFEQLETIYRHPVEAGQGGGRIGDGKLPPAMTELDLAGPGQWGRLEFVSSEGRKAIFVLDFGAELRVTTFVVVAD